MPMNLAKTPLPLRSMRASVIALLCVVVSVSAHAESPTSKDQQSYESTMPRLQLSMGERTPVRLGAEAVTAPQAADPNEDLSALLRELSEHMSYTQALIQGRAQLPLFLEDRVRVAIYSESGERLTLQNQRHVTVGKESIILKKTTRTYEDFCTTPCHLEVTAGAYRFAVADGESWRKARTLESPRRVYIHQDTELWIKRKSRRPARAGFFSAMAASVIAGIAVGIVSAIEQRDDSRSLPPSRGPLMGALSGGLVLAGGGFFVGGMLSRDTFEVDMRPYRPPEEK